MSMRAELILVAALGAMSVASALAQEIDGSYQGTHEAGGPVTVVVAADPLRIVTYEIEGVAGGGCSWDTITLADWGGEIVLVGGQFDATNADGDTLTGSWLAEGVGGRRFEGTIQVRDPVKGCETPPLRWVTAAVTP